MKTLTPKRYEDILGDGLEHVLSNGANSLDSIAKGLNEINISGPNFYQTVSLYPDSYLNYETTLNLIQVLGINEGNYDEVPEQIKRWNKARGQVLNGLVRRRDAEAELFVS